VFVLEDKNFVIGIVSDIHGNYPALRQVIQKLRMQGCTDIYCLGDTAGYYSMINECIDLLRRERIVSLKGNHDSYLLGDAFCPRSQSVNDCIDYQRQVITQSNFEWLKGLSPVLTTKSFHAVHGGLNNPLDEYIVDFDFESPAVQQCAVKIFLSGHTHVQKMQERDDVIYCNPGSVGQPRDHDWRAAYAILNQATITLHRTEYNVNETAEAMKNAGFSSYYYGNLFYGYKIGEHLA